MLLTESSRSPPATHIGIHICNVNRLQEQAHTQRCISSKCHMPESCNVSEFTYRTTVFSKPKRTAKEGGAREKVKEEESLKSRSDSTTTPPPRQWTHAPARVGQGAFLQPASDPSALAGRVCHCARVTQSFRVPGVSHHVAAQHKHTTPVVQRTVICCDARRENKYRTGRIGNILQFVSDLFDLQESFGSHPSVSFCKRNVIALSRIGNYRGPY